MGSLVREGELKYCGTLGEGAGSLRSADGSSITWPLIDYLTLLGLKPWFQPPSAAQCAPPLLWRCTASCTAAPLNLPCAKLNIGSYHCCTKHTAVKHPKHKSDELGNTSCSPPEGAGFESRSCCSWRNIYIFFVPSAVAIAVLGLFMNPGGSPALPDCHMAPCAHGRHVEYFGSLWKPGAGTSTTESGFGGLPTPIAPPSLGLVTSPFHGIIPPISNVLRSCMVE